MSITKFIYSTFDGHLDHKNAAMDTPVKVFWQNCEDTFVGCGWNGYIQGYGHIQL